MKYGFDVVKQPGLLFLQVNTPSGTGPEYSRIQFSMGSRDESKEKLEEHSCIDLEQPKTASGVLRVVPALGTVGTFANSQIPTRLNSSELCL